MNVAVFALGVAVGWWFGSRPLRWTPADDRKVAAYTFPRSVP